MDFSLVNSFFSANFATKKYAILCICDEMALSLSISVRHTRL